MNEDFCKMILKTSATIYSSCTELSFANSRRAEYLRQRLLYVVRALRGTLLYMLFLRQRLDKVSVISSI